MLQANWLQTALTAVLGLAVALGLPVHEARAADAAAPNPTPQPPPEAPPRREGQALGTDPNAAATPEPLPTPGAASLTKAAVDPENLGVFGSTTWGGRGLLRLASAMPATSHALVLSLSTAYSRTHGLFLAGDKNVRSGQGIDLLFAPMRGLQLSGSYRMLTDNYEGLVRRSLTVQGNPTVRATYGHHVAGPVALGAQVAYGMPTSALGRGLVAAAYTLDVSGLISLALHPRVELVANAGYGIDRSDKIFGPGNADALQRFAYGIHRVNQVPYGLGAQGRITLGSVLDVAPFAEVTGAVGLGRGATFANSPLRASGGLKFYPTSSRAVELTVGADVALRGRVGAGSPFAGQPGWEAFAQLHSHFGNMWQARAQGPAVPAQAAPREPESTFRITGAVLDADTQRPIYGARVVVGEQNEVLLATDDATGRFASWPLSAKSGLIRVTARASGYLDQERVLPRPKQGAVVDLAFAPKADNARPHPALLRGIARDARTGKAVPGAVLLIEELGQRIVADGNGAFAAKVKPGRYRVRQGGAHYTEQTRVLTLRPNETLLYNADLRPD